MASFFVDIKKIPAKAARAFLVGGAGLILGLLSFGGMYALMPVLPLAFGAFALSVAYEGEIYKQNIKQAWQKLFKPHYLLQQMANQFLLDHFPTDEDAALPSFFSAYLRLCKELHHFEHKRLDKPSLARKEQLQKSLRLLEKWFAAQCLTPLSAADNAEEKALKQWINKQSGGADFLNKYRRRQRLFRGVGLFSGVSGAFMALGTTYLLVEAFSLIPFLATLSAAFWPVAIVPMALIAGTAYALLTYNAITDFITNDTLRHWYRRIRDTIRREGFGFKQALVTLIALALVALAVALTVCTAGTWWTITKQTKPLFQWMGTFPSFVMGIINPIITGLSAIVFNLENTSETLEMITDGAKHIISRLRRLGGDMLDYMTKPLREENVFQWFNPFRLLIQLTFLPLRLLLFFGHLLSIGVTADRVPGVSSRTSGALGVISEGFEDTHYFFGHGEHTHEPHTHEHHAHEHHHHVDHDKALLMARLAPQHGHHHGADLPTQLLKTVFLPLYLLAASWEYLASRAVITDKGPLTFAAAWDKHRGNKPLESVDFSAEFKSQSAASSTYASFLIERFITKQLVSARMGRSVAREKITQLRALSTTLSQPQSAENNLSGLIKTHVEENKRLYGRPRFLFWAHTQTRTMRFLDELPQRIEYTATPPSIKPT